jgi:hypothetical protein
VGADDSGDPGILKRNNFICMPKGARAMRFLLIVVAMLPMIFGVADALAQGGVDGVVPPPVFDEQPIGTAPPPSEIQPITEVVPLWGTTLRERGANLPLPFGLGVTYTYLAQDTEVSHVKVRNRQLDLDIPAAKTASHTVLLRADVWLLPVLNVYGMLGYTNGQTEPRLRLSDGTTLKKTVSYSRAMYGGGATLAAGYRAFFLTLDGNYTTGAVQTDEGQIGNHEIYSITFTPRLGAIFSSGAWGEGSAWVGGMYMDFEQEVRDSLSARDQDVDYSVRIKAKEPWNLLLGGNWQLNKRWSIALELGGVMDRFQATGAAMFRF